MYLVKWVIRLYLIKYMNKIIQNLFTDSQSVSRKSAKTNKSPISKKPIQIEKKKFQTQFFTPNQLVHRIEQRASSKINVRTPNKKQQDRFNKTQKILHDLFQKHRYAKQKLQNLKLQMQQRNEKQYPFKPHAPKRQKYIIKGDIIRRNEIWLEQRNKRHVQRKQNKLMQDLSECTFTPQIISKEESSIYLKNKDLSTTSRRKSPLSTSKTINKRQISAIQYQEQKKKIYNRLYTIQV